MKRCVPDEVLSVVLDVIDHSIELTSCAVADIQLKELTISSSTRVATRLVSDVIDMLKLGDHDVLSGVWSREDEPSTPLLDRHAARAIKRRNRPSKLQTEFAQDVKFESDRRSVPYARSATGTHLSRRSMRKEKAIVSKNQQEEIQIVSKTEEPENKELSAWRTSCLHAWKDDQENKKKESQKDTSEDTTAQFVPRTNQPEPEIITYPPPNRLQPLKTNNNGAEVVQVVEKSTRKKKTRRVEREPASFFKSCHDVPHLSATFIPTEVARAKLDDLYHLSAGVNYTRGDRKIQGPPSPKARSHRPPLDQLPLKMKLPHSSSAPGLMTRPSSSPVVVRLKTAAPMRKKMLRPSGSATSIRSSRERPLSSTGSRRRKVARPV